MEQVQPSDRNETEMLKQEIFKPRKTLVSAAKNIRLIVKDLGVEGASEIGVEILKVGDTYYTVKNVYKPTPFDTLWGTDDASERVSVVEALKVVR